MTIEIRDLGFECIIGILDFERTQKQRVMINTKIDYRYTPGSFLDYVAVVECITSEMIRGQFELLEEALQHLRSLLKERFPAIEQLDLAIEKPDILPQCRVRVSLHANF